MINPIDLQSGCPEQKLAATCSFCNKHYREVGPLVEGPAFDDGCSYSLGEVGKRLDMPPQRVCEIETQALEKLGP